LGLKRRSCVGRRFSCNNVIPREQNIDSFSIKTVIKLRGNKMQSNNNEELLILWTNDNVGTSMNMVLMYAENAKVKRWWEEVTLLIWGSTAKLVCENEKIENYIKILLKEKVRVIACKQCAENYEVVEKLEKQGIEVFYTGQFLTEWIKENKKYITI
jgi:hypothetical protein